MLSLTEEQRVKVEENMGLVGKVIQDCVHTLDKGCIYDYDDLFQIGCIGLCKASQTDRPGYKGAFSTYAYLLIRNEIYTQLEYATRRGRELATDPAELPIIALKGDELEQRESCSHLLNLLECAERMASGVVAKGIQADCLLAVYDNARSIRSGTGMTVNYAKAKGLEIVFIHPDTATVWVESYANH